MPPALPVICDTGLAPASSVRQRMRLLQPTASKRLNEAVGFVFLAAGILFLLSIASYSPRDPSLNTVAGAVRTGNMIGPVGAWGADLTLQMFGLAAFLFPVFLFILGWKWIRSESPEAPLIRLIGGVTLVLSFCG